MKPKDGGGYLYVYQYKDHLGNVRLSYADLDGNGKIESGSEILEEKNYYPFGLQHDGYNMGVRDERRVEAEQIKYNGKEFKDSFGLNMYEYGARSYDPALGRFFNMDNYAENYFDFTPYQYAANNPVYFIDVNGDYIYINDGGKNYKFDGGLLYDRDDKGNWVESPPEAGSFLEQVYFELKAMYDFSASSGGGSGTSSVGGQSFSNWFLNLFNNENLNATFKKNPNPKDERAAVHQNGWIYLNFSTIDKVKAYTTNNKFEKIDSFLTFGHELAHAFSYNLISQIMRQGKWIEGNNFKASVDEIFAVYIENSLRSVRNIPIRTHYLGTGHESEVFKKSQIYIQNEKSLQFEMTTHGLHILNNYKKRIQNKGIIWRN